MSATEYEIRVLDALEQIDYEDMLDLSVFDEMASWVNGWAAVLSYQGRDVYIDINYRPQPLKREELTRVLARTLDNQPAGYKALLICNQPLTGMAQALLSESPVAENLVFVRWQSSADNEALQRAVSTALSRSSARSGDE